MTMVDLASDEIFYALRRESEKLSALLRTVERLDCLAETVLTDELDQAYQLICLASEVGKKLCYVTGQADEQFFQLARRLDRPDPGDHLPGEVLLELLRAVAPDSDGKRHAEVIALKASTLIRYAEHDVSFQPSVLFMVEEIGKLGFDVSVEHDPFMGPCVRIDRRSAATSAEA